MDATLAPALAELAAARERLARLRTPPVGYVGTFRAPGPTRLLRRGDVLQPDQVVTPGGLSALPVPLQLPADAGEAARRQALADWIASPQNPLPARVLVNRLWHYHFGQGLVRTPSDFGFNGDRPSHPELLDFLAAEFLRNGGHAKPIHRLIVTSRAYRQGSRIDPAMARIDADNRLLWRFGSRRLEAEKIRDAVVQVSGALRQDGGGPGYHLWDYSGYVTVFTPKETLGPEALRRMVYQFKPRSQADRTFGAFDCPDGTGVTPKRAVSTTPLQALNLLNDGFMLDQAGRLAERIQRDAGGAPERQAELAFRLVLLRSPAAGERAGAADLVRRHGLMALCRALLNCNEFVTLE